MNVTPQLHEFYRMLCLSFGATAVCGVLAYAQIWQRRLWLRCLDAEEKFWLRFGIPKGGSGRRFCESRFCTVTTVGLGIAFFFVSLACVFACIHFRHQIGPMMK